ncbi:MAG: hypothetical protein EXQ69_09925 [Acidimicrobiia bacterium]|nr:hypothetical protein [Acidimicrobiia bacterium]
MEDPFDTGPGPGRGAFIIAYCSVVAAGLIGAGIGYGYSSATCLSSCGTANAIGALVGAVCASVGVGIVAVLALRAMAEWRRPRH